MIGIVNAISAAFGAIGHFFKWLSQGRLIRAGEDKAVRHGLEKTLQALAKVKHAMRSARIDLVRKSDPYKRD